MKPNPLLLRCLLVLSIIVSHQPSSAQTIDAAAAANAAYQQKDWSTALKLYGELAQASPNNPRY